MKPTRLYREPVARSGKLNMALDEWLLNQAIHQEVCSLRFYQWAVPTLSLGHFQGIHQEVPEELQDLDRVQRLSGGGAILHDQELTYSCCIAASHPLATNPTEMYGVFHDAYRAALLKQGIETGMRGVEDQSVNDRFLCFFRGDRHDLMCGGRKVLGSAQRRRKGAVLQHGSLIYRASERAPEVLGVQDVCGAEVDLGLLIDDLIVILSEHFSPWESTDFPAELLQAES